MTKVRRPPTLILSRTQLGFLVLSVVVGALGSGAGLLASGNDRRLFDAVYSAGLALSVLGAMAVVVAYEGRRRAVFERTLRRQALERITTRLREEVAARRLELQPSDATTAGPSDAVVADAKRRLKQSRHDFGLLRELGAYDEAAALHQAQIELRELIRTVAAG